MISKVLLILTSLSLIFSSISCEREISVSGPHEYETGIANYYVSTEPQGATIFVNDKNTGLFSPDTIKWLPEGVHNFVLNMDPFLDYPFEAEVVNNLTNSKESQSTKPKGITICQ